jgi:glycosyltransferase involved in cell wall biosynthesis
MNPPEISVVMAAANAASTVEACLNSLRRQSVFPRAEVIVADCSTDGTDEVIRRRFPEVRLLHFDRPVGLPQLLREAFQHAQGRVVAVTEPHCTFAADWLEKLCRAHDSPFEIIGGAVENGRRNGTLSWACYFVDYGAFMLPAQRQVTHVLAGNNVSYKRGIIEQALPSMQEGYWKGFFHWDLAKQGSRFLFDPEPVAYYIRPDTFGSFLRRYYRRGWFFAALRSKRISFAARFFHLTTTPALPFFLLYRRLRAPWSKRRHTRELLLSVPLVAVFVSAWAAGELTGYLLGPSRLPREAYR